MKNNEKNVQEVEEMVVVEETEVIENEHSGKLAKVGGFVKKHGKKIAIGAGVALAGAAVFVAKTLLKSKDGSDALDYIGDDDTDIYSEDIIDSVAEVVEE